MTGLGRQAKVLTDGQVRAMLAAVSAHRTADRDATMVLMSVRAGMRSKEIAGATWSMLVNAEGQLCDTLRLPNSASKGHRGGREIPLHPELLAALARLYGDGKPATARVVLNSRGQPLGANGTAQWFLRLYRSLGFEGCSSHSGRRTAITGWARKISAAGGSLRDVQALAGHAALTDTQRYIDENHDAKRRVVLMTEKGGPALSPLRGSMAKYDAPQGGPALSPLKGAWPNAPHDNSLPAIGAKIRDRWLDLDKLEGKAFDARISFGRADLDARDALGRDIDKWEGKAFDARLALGRLLVQAQGQVQLSGLGWEAWCKKNVWARSMPAIRRVMTQAPEPAIAREAEAAPARRQ